MELAFATRSLRTLCEREKEAERKLGLKVAQTLKRRLADLRAAPSAGDLIAGLTRIEESDFQKALSISLEKNVRLIFAANHNDVPMLKNGAVHWSKVTRIKLIAIEANHD